MRYGLLRACARFLLRLFYRRVEVVGLENVPEAGPLIVAANHHNSVVDAMLLVAVVPRRVRTLANAPLFHHPLIGPFLRMMGALPVHRRQEAGSDPARNAELFAATTATLRGGGAIMIFPEGRTQPEPVLLELRTGAARMLLAAEQGSAAAPPVSLLPVGLVFEAPGTFRAGQALVLVGPALATADCVALARTAPEQAARALTERLAEALRGRIVEAKDRHTLLLLGVVEELARAEAGMAEPRQAERVAWMQEALRAYSSLLTREPARVDSFRRQLEQFLSALAAAGLTQRQVDHDYAPSVVLAFVMREGFALLVGAPLALAGIAIHALPYELTGVLVRRLLRFEEEEATDKIFAGLVLYPLAWLAEGGLAWRLGGARAAWAFLAAVPITAFFALAWQERLSRVAREAAAFFRFLRDPGVTRRLREQRRTLAAELLALAKLAPEAGRE